MRPLQMKASQSIKRARALLREMDTLRNQVADIDLSTFDDSMNPSRRLILDAIDMFKSNFNFSIFVLYRILLILIIITR